MPDVPDAKIAIPAPQTKQDIGEAFTQQAAPQSPGAITGKVIDQTGITISGAKVTLTREGQTSSQESVTDEDGLFVFSNVVPGPFKLTFSSEGLAPQEYSGTLQPGERFVVPQMMLAVATQVTEVVVGLSPVELAQQQVKDQEKQRVLGFIPNFYVSYVPDATPLNPKQKFELAWKSASDPVTIAAVGAVAGLNQAGDRWSEFGQGAQGYAKRFGASYGDVFTGTFIGGAVLPSVLKQDPRYFYKGTGTKKSRLLYALANTVICKGDNGRWQPNYSSIGGNFAAGGISTLYYPSRNQSDAMQAVSIALIRMGEVALANVFQELVFPKFTSNRPGRSNRTGEY